MLFLYNVLLTLFRPATFQASCSSVDHIVVKVSLVVTLVAVVGAVLVNFFVFAGLPTRRRPCGFGGAWSFLVQVGTWSVAGPLHFWLEQRTLKNQLCTFVLADRPWRVAHSCHDAGLLER